MGETKGFSSQRVYDSGAFFDSASISTVGDENPEMD